MNIKDLTREELIQLIKENTFGTNQISIMGFEVASSTANLKEIEKVISRLIKKNKDFVLMHREHRIKTGIGYVG